MNKISIRTLPNNSLQEVFDFVVDHLRKQGVRSFVERDFSKPHIPASEPYGCLYRGPNGLMCAVGCLISDDEYRPRFEGAIVQSVLRDVLRNVFTDANEHLEEMSYLLVNLQNIHDRRDPRAWEESFEDTARKYGLILKEKQDALF